MNRERWRPYAPVAQRRTKGKAKANSEFLNERVRALIDAAKRSSDPSATLGESEYGAILKGLEIAGRDELALRITEPTTVAIKVQAWKDSQHKPE